MKDLFGHEPGVDPHRNKPVRLSLTNFAEKETPLAWALSNTGRIGQTKPAPKSLVTRGVGTDVNVYTMPRWLAVEKGWL